MERKEKKYVIGVDGGGTKTTAALSDLTGEILKTSTTGPSNLRNLGIEKATSNILKAILEVIDKIGEKEVILILLALAALEEEFKPKRKALKEILLKEPKILKVLKGEIRVISDQVAAFRSGTDEKTGLVLIAGTGTVARGWRGEKEIKVSGWGWLNDEGSGFWIGQRGYEALFKHLDGRGPKTQVTELLFKQWKLKNKEELMRKIYSEDAVKNVSLISRAVNEAAKLDDKIAVSILKEAGKELAQTAISVIEKLRLENQKFPLVLVGGTFKSKIVLDVFKTKISKIAPRAQFVRPKNPPVMGVVKLALEQIQSQEANS